MKDTGKMHLPEQKLMLRKVGEVEGPYGTYWVCIDGRDQPVVKSMNTGKKFILTWENIVEIAVNSGIDDRGGPWVPRHITMKCEAGVFVDGQQIHVPHKG